MKKISVLIGFSYFICFALLAITEDKFQFDDPKQSALFLELTKELRCPKCQNQNIADSDAMIAVDLKRKVHELVLAGYTKEQVVDYMKDRYGNFVFYQPPVNSMTIWLWIIPAVFVFGTLGWIVFGRKKSLAEFDEEKLEKAKAILEREK